ncbi:MAG: M23 family metallopeptidase [Sneathiella sp.]
MIRFVISLLCLLPAALQAGEVKLSGNLIQGGLVVGMTDPSADVRFEGTTVRVSDAGRFIIGFGRDFKKLANLTVKFEDGSTATQALEIQGREYLTEKVNGLPPGKVTPSKKFLKRIRKENGEIARIRSIDTPDEWFLSGWKWPAKGRISGVYGSQRVLNNIPKRPHFGLDVAAVVGTPVYASTDGLVRMAETDLYYTGGTIMIDHGHGLVSVYSHLSKLSVSAGVFVPQGTKIGEIGATGRASGPHLDWRLNWFNERLDPQLLLKKMPKK